MLNIWALKKEEKKLMEEKRRKAMTSLPTWIIKKSKKSWKSKDFKKSHNGKNKKNDWITKKRMFLSKS